MLGTQNSTPITAATKISTLLAEYPQALDVLVAASPAFQKLKNPVLRKLFTARVSIEQAATIGGVSSEELLRSLRQSCGVVTSGGETIIQDGTINILSERPAILGATSEKDVILLDVRADLAQNKDPFQKIMKAVKHLKPNQILHLVNGFEPAPLYEVLGNRGFAHWTEEREGIWNVYFFKSLDATPPSSSTLGTPLRDTTLGAPEQPSGDVIELDVSGLEPPEPMQRILMALSTLPVDSTLLIHHHREPFLLYDQLTTRGFAWKTDKLGNERYRILIFRSNI